MNMIKEQLNNPTAFKLVNTLLSLLRSGTVSPQLLTEAAKFACMEYDKEQEQAITEIGGDMTYSIEWAPRNGIIVLRNGEPVPTEEILALLNKGNNTPKLKEFRLIKYDEGTEYNGAICWFLVPAENYKKYKEIVNLAAKAEASEEEYYACVRQVGKYRVTDENMENLTIVE